MPVSAAGKPGEMVAKIADFGLSALVKRHVPELLSLELSDRSSFEQPAHEQQNRSITPESIFMTPRQNQIILAEEADRNYAQHFGYDDIEASHRAMEEVRSKSSTISYLYVAS